MLTFLPFFSEEPEDEEEEGEEREEEEEKEENAMALALDLDADTAQPVFRRQWSGVFSKILEGIQ